MEHDFRVIIDGGIEPDFQIIFKLNLFLVDNGTI